MQFSADYRKWVEALIIRYRDPEGNPPQAVKGGKNAVSSPESDSTNLGNQYIHEGVWWQTLTHDGRKFFIFIPDPNKIQGKNSSAWTTFLIQDDKGYRFDWAGGDVLYHLLYGRIDED